MHSLSFVISSLGTGCLLSVLGRENVMSLQGRMRWFSIWGRFRACTAPLGICLKSSD